jgi:hypothetical protein
MSALNKLIDSSGSGQFEFNIYDKKLKKSIQVQVGEIYFKYKQIIYLFK